jgi:hypothetical protein
MIPRSSDIGYLVYEDLILPITSVVMTGGDVMMRSFVTSESRERITVDEHAACTVVGVDGSQIFWVDRSGPPFLRTACFGGTMAVEQKLVIHSSERDLL